MRELKYSQDPSAVQIQRLRNIADGLRIYKDQEIDATTLADRLDDIANQLVAGFSSGVPSGYRLVPVETS